MNITLSLYMLLWFPLLFVSVIAVFQLVGTRLMVCYFPEGRRWWMFPSQLLSLVAFAAIVINHPFQG